MACFSLSYHNPEWPLKEQTGLFPILLLVAGLIAGCASRKEIVRFQEDTAAIQDRLTGLQKDNEQMREQLKEINRSIQSLRDSNASVKADLLSEMSTLREETAYLRNLLDDTGSRMSRMMQNFDRPAGAGDAAAGDSGSPPSPESAKTLYDAAYLDLSRKNYDLAAGEFREYLRLYPASEYSGNAQYWIAEIIYVKKDYAAALAEFRKVIEAYPKSGKVRAARLKAAYCRLHLNDTAGARVDLEKIVREFPGTEEARLAAGRLKEIQ